MSGVSPSTQNLTTPGVRFAKNVWGDAFSSAFRVVDLLIYVCIIVGVSFGLAASYEENEQKRRKKEQTTWLLLVVAFGFTGLFSFSRWGLMSLRD
jgi:formate hydrogenlyase subunit 3/multisubunit Na+/H+ antiporter MnhD subunit